MRELFRFGFGPVTSQQSVSSVQVKSFFTGLVLPTSELLVSSSSLPPPLFFSNDNQPTFFLRLTRVGPGEQPTTTHLCCCPHVVLFQGLGPWALPGILSAYPPSYLIRTKKVNLQQRRCIIPHETKATSSSQDPQTRRRAFSSHSSTFPCILVVHRRRHQLWFSNVINDRSSHGSVGATSLPRPCWRSEEIQWQQPDEFQRLSRTTRPGARASSSWFQV